MGDIFEGLPVGKKVFSMGRTISEGDFSLLVNLNWTISSLHVDAEYMKSTQFGERILPGVCVLSTTIGLANIGGVRQPLLDRQLRLVALVGFDNVRFTGPVHPGDTITVESEILDVSPTSNPARSLVRFKDVTRKQTGETVMEDIRVELYELVK